MKRVAIYVRSASKDKLGKIERQLVELKEFATVNGGTIVDIYVDDGCSGRRICRRPALAKMLRDCKKGKVDEVLILTKSHLARDVKVYLKICSKLEKYGISLVSADQGNIDYMEKLLLLPMKPMRIPITDEDCDETEM